MKATRLKCFLPFAMAGSMAAGYLVAGERSKTIVMDENQIPGEWLESENEVELPEWRLRAGVDPARSIVVVLAEMEREEESRHEESIHISSSSN